MAAIQDNRQGRDFQGNSQRSNNVQQGGNSRNTFAAESPKPNSFNSRSQAAVSIFDILKKLYISKDTKPTIEFWICSIAPRGSPGRLCSTHYIQPDGPFFEQVNFRFNMRLTQEEVWGIKKNWLVEEQRNITGTKVF